MNKLSDVDLADIAAAARRDINKVAQAMRAFTEAATKAVAGQRRRPGYQEATR